MVCLIRVNNLTKHKRKRKKLEDLFNYEVSVYDWTVNVFFNEYAYMNIFNVEQFEEQYYMVLEGKVSSSTSKKCDKDMLAEVIIHPGEFWYDPNRIREGVDTIGYMSIEKKDSEIYKEDTILFRVIVPTKSYENIRSYLTYKGKAFIKLLGSDLYYRKGDIYYFEFKRESFN